MAGREFRAEFGPGPIEQTWRVGLTPAEMTALVDAAVASGRVHPANRDAWLVEVAAAGTRGANAITALTELYPAADSQMRAAWAAAPGQTDAERLYAAVFPEDRLEPGELDGITVAAAGEEAASCRGPVMSRTSPATA